MALNHPILTLRKVTLHDVDVNYAKQQKEIIIGLLRSHKLSRTERNALDGIRNLLCAVVGEEDEHRPLQPVKRIRKQDINRMRDLHLAGKTPEAIAKQFGYRTLAVTRLLKGETYTDVPHTPSEFALEVKREKRND